MNETLSTIFARKSIRRYQDRPIAEADIRTILEAGMAGPTCVNARDWSFLVVTDREVLNAMADANGRPAQPLRTAPLAILICGDMGRAFPPAKDYAVIDTSIAAENMILAAQSLGIGSVWLGTWPQMDRVKNQAALFGLPEDIVPHSVIAFGYPAEDPDKSAKPRYEEDRVHFNRW